MLDLFSDPLAESAKTSVLCIERWTAIKEFNSIRADNEIVIGDNRQLSQFVSVIGSNHAIARSVPVRDQPRDVRKAGIRIGNDVWIDAHAVILPGVQIADAAVAAADVAATRDVPAYAIVAGVPADIKRHRK